MTQHPEHVPVEDQAEITYSLIGRLGDELATITMDIRYPKGKGLAVVDVFKLHADKLAMDMMEKFLEMGDDSAVSSFQAYLAAQKEDGQ